MECSALAVFDTSDETSDKVQMKYRGGDVGRKLSECGAVLEGEQSTRPNMEIGGWMLTSRLL